MSLTQIMSAAKLDLYPQVSLILFLVAFAFICWRVFSSRFKAADDAAARMPLDDEHPQTPRTRGE
ncbi:MAG: cbb3-type cytochrome c oxidase subunit 3 [Gemmatimonadaceae bacterium]